MGKLYTRIQTKTAQNPTLRGGTYLDGSYKGTALTALTATSAIRRIFAELNNPKRALSKMNLTSMEASNAKHVLAMFLT